MNILLLFFILTLSQIDNHQVGRVFQWWKCKTLKIKLVKVLKKVKNNFLKVIFRTVKSLNINLISYFSTQEVVDFIAAAIKKGKLPILFNLRTYYIKGLTWPQIPGCTWWCTPFPQSGFELHNSPRGFSDPWARAPSGLWPPRCRAWPCSWQHNP